MADQEGFEPPTNRFEDLQLKFNYIFIIHLTDTLLANVSDKGYKKHLRSDKNQAALKNIRFKFTITK